MLTRCTTVLRKSQRHKDSNELMFARAGSTVVAGMDDEIFHSECSPPNKMTMGGGRGEVIKRLRGWGGELINCPWGEVKQ